MGKDKKKIPSENGVNGTIFQRTERYLNANFNIRYNIITNELLSKAKSESQFERLNIDKLYVFLQNNRFNIDIQKLNSLLNSGVMENYNPIENYFEKISKTERNTTIDYIDQLSNYVITKNQNRFKYQFKKTLVRMVACALDDKVINKQAFILVHDKQNSGKTTFLNWLCPLDLEEYITENIGTDKDSLIALGENFIINMDELATFNRSEINSLKSMLSKAYIKVRHPFGKKAILTSRKASFVGSTNKTTFLNDETGSVRWLCFELEKINWNYKKEIDINFVWAQAYDLYISDFEYELTAKEIEENEKENRKHLLHSFEIDFLQQNYVPGTKDDNEGFFTSTDFLKVINEKLGSSFKTSVQNIGKALKILEFDQTNKYNGTYTIKGYYFKNNFNNDLTRLRDIQ
ncbi:MAG: VapE domain-containing protein [Bacteroidota bacterium]